MNKKRKIFLKFCFIVLATILFYPTKNLFAESSWDGDFKNKKNASKNPRVLNATVYLTFDDGPRYGTDDCVVVLTEKELKGTFLMIGSHMDTSWYENRVKDAENAGNLLGNHSYSHWDSSSNYEDDCPPGKTNSQWLDDFLSNDTRLSEVLDISPAQKFIYSRLPGKNAWRVSGIDKDDGNSGRVADHLSGNGYDIYGWDIEWHYSGNPSASDPVENPQTVVDNIKTLLSEGTETKPGKVIVLMHDHMFRASRGNRIKLAEFIQKLKDLGAKFETIDKY